VVKAKELKENSYVKKSMTPQQSINRGPLKIDKSIENESSEEERLSTTESAKKQKIDPANSFSTKPQLSKNKEGQSTNSKKIFREKDDPKARVAFELLRTSDPKTGKLPDNIRLKELKFMKAQDQKFGVRFDAGDLLTSWQNRGPNNVGGRTRALAVDINDENILLAGGVSGGMWRSTDQGNTWAKTTGSNELQSVTCVAQDHSNPNIWYYGTGEWSGNSAGDPGAFYLGDGIYKSNDNGLTWSVLQATSTNLPQVWDQHFDFNHELVVNPTNGNLLVATTGGIYQSTDGGANFSLVLEGGGNSRWSDIVMSSTGTAFAVIDDQGVWTSTDGVNWSAIHPGSETGFTLYANDRKELALAPSNEDIL
jgi:photosystem II stability/assembly factor-like uncharacterized protein